MTNFDDFLAEADTVAIAGHVRPDGDCAGSCLATYNYIKTYYPKIKVDLYLEPIPNIFKFLSRSEEIISEGLKIPVKTKKAAQKRADTAFDRLVAAGRRLMDVIYKNEQIANKDKAKFEAQILNLAEKWNRYLDE